MARNGRRRTHQKGREFALVERQVSIWEAYKRGKTMQQIAAEFGLSQQTIGNEIRGYLAELRMQGLQSVMEYRQVQMERIRTAVDAIWPRVLAGNTDAVNAFIRLMEREARLLGLDAPTKIDIRAKIEALAISEGINPEEALDVADAVYREVAAT